MKESDIDWVIKHNQHKFVIAESDSGCPTAVQLTPRRLYAVDARLSLSAGSVFIEK